LRQVHRRRIVAGLDRPSAGVVRLGGTDLATLSGEGRRQWHRALQMIFQNPVGSLDPRLPIGRQIREPLDLHGVGTAPEREAQVRALLAAVSLPDRHRGALPAPDQRRAGPARGDRAGARLRPRLIVCDEPVSAST
jgi:ABC-type glutathione transport system ATPase component